MSTESEQFSTVLTMAGIAPAESDLGQLTMAFAIARENVALVNSVAAARYEEPALIFAARP
jgi:hypothetical protein